MKVDSLRKRTNVGRSASPWWLAHVGVLAVGFFALPAACSSRNGFQDDRPSFGSGDAASADGCRASQCSPDLRKVLDGCTGEVVLECPSDQACGDGRCLPACEAASVSQGSIGCDFYAIPPDTRTSQQVSGENGSCFAVFVANTWDEPLTISAEYAGHPLDISAATYVATKAAPDPHHPPIYGGPYDTHLPQGQMLPPLVGPVPPGEVAVVFLSALLGAGESAKGKVYGAVIMGCPGNPALRIDPIGHGTTRTAAFRIKTDRPASAYQMYPFGGALSFFPSASLLLPASSWTTNYVAVNPWPGIFESNPFLQVVATEPDTEVRIRPTADIVPGNGVPGATAGQVGSWTLGAGEVLQINQFEELTGSTIASNKPVGVFGGHESMVIPNSSTPAADVLSQQIPPLAHWGSEYALVPAASRSVTPEEVFYRVVAAVDGTVFTYDSAGATPVAAPASLDAGQSAIFSTRAPAVIRSQDADHPFYAAVYMTGCSYDSGFPGALGDPDFVNLVASGQYLDRYVFYTDYSYAESWLTIVRHKGTNGFAPIDLDCAGELSGFTPLDAVGDYEIAYVALTHGFIEQSFGSGTCGVGRHEMKSAEPFALYVWGLDYAASYGYPGGTGLRPITTVTVDVLR